MSYTGSFVRFNALTNVDYLKTTTKTTTSFAEAKANKGKITTDVVLFASYDATNPIIEATYIAPEDISKGFTFSLYKKTPNQAYYTYLCTLEEGEFQFKDYNILSNEYYHYLAAAETVGAGGLHEYRIYEKTSEGEQVYDTSVFNCWTICDVEESTEKNIYIKTGNVWNLGLNLEREDVNQTLGITTWDTLGRYGQVSLGKKNYDKGDFSSLLGSIVEYIEYSMPSQTKQIDGVLYGYIEELNQWFPLQELGYAKEATQYTEKQTSFSSVSATQKLVIPGVYAREVDKLIAWKEFVSNGSLKLLRDTKGNGWLISIIDTPSYSINTQAINQLTTITFSWQEIVDLTEVSIINIDDVDGE